MIVFIFGGIFMCLYLRMCPPVVVMPRLRIGDFRDWNDDRLRCSPDVEAA